jgi:hypothetical protein
VVARRCCCAHADALPLLLLLLLPLLLLAAVKAAPVQQLLRRRCRRTPGGASVSVCAYAAAHLPLPLLPWLLVPAVASLHTLERHLGRPTAGTARQLMQLMLHDAA